MTHFVRRVVEAYCLSTRLVGIEVQIGGNWIDVKAVPEALRDAIVKQLGPIIVGQVSRSTEITIPTDGLLQGAELAHCGSCEPAQKPIELELKNWCWKSSCWSVKTNDARVGSPTANCRSSTHAARSPDR